MVYKHAYINTLLLLHSIFMLSVVKMGLKREVGGHALNGPRREKTCLRRFAINTDAERPAQSYSTFVIPFWKVSYVDMIKEQFQISSWSL